MEHNGTLRDQVLTAFAENWFCTLATSSAKNRPHVAGVLYQLVDRDLYVSTDRASRKAINIAENRRVAVGIAVPVIPAAPPFTAHFQGTAVLLDSEDPEITTLVGAGRLESITSHGELSRPGSCFVRITPGHRVATFGFGASEETLVNDPLNAASSVVW